MFEDVPPLLPWVLIVVPALWLLLAGKVRWAWTVAGAILCALPLLSPEPPTLTDQIIRIGFAGLLVIGFIAPLRRWWITSMVMGIVKKVLPAISDTEREALEGGTVWWDGEIFSGAPADTTDRKRTRIHRWPCRRVDTICRQLEGSPGRLHLR